MGWITDTSDADLDLSSYLCNVSGPAHCREPLRSCQFDSVLTADASFNTSRCGPERRCYTCLHKTLLPLVGQDALMSVTLALCQVLAGASGIGGGGLNVPVLMLTSDFLVEEAAPLSNIMVLGNAIAQNLVNARRRHPLSAYRLAIDLEVPLLLLPPQLVGNAFGVMLQPILPATGVKILACLLLLYAGSKTLFVARANFKREQLRRQQEAPHALGAQQLGREELERPLTGVAAAGADGAVEVARAADEAASYKWTSTRQLLLLVGLWLLFLLVFVGRDLTPGGPCAPQQLAWLGVQLGIPVVAVGMAARQLKGADADADADADGGGGGGGAAAERRERLPGDVQWTRSSVVALPCVAALIGLMAGILGLGGGELMAPLLLAIGMLPQVATSTSACMVLFTSSSDLAHYLDQGTLSPEPGYVLWLFCVGFVSALTGRVLAMTLVARLAHPSLLAFVLAASLFTALALLGVQMSSSPIDWAFGDLCT